MTRRLDTGSDAAAAPSPSPSGGRILHLYKIYWPEIDGGIPAVIANLTDANLSTRSEILVARKFGLFRTYLDDRTPVTAVTSFGTLASTPLAPTFPFWVWRRARKAETVVHHAPFPLTDLAVSLGTAGRSNMIVYWHAEIVGRRILKWLLAPLIRRALKRADRIIVSHEIMISVSAFLTPHRHKCAAVPYGIDTRYWSALDPEQQTAVDVLRGKYPRLIVATGRLVGYKGYEVLLHAMRDLNAQLIIVGDGPLRESLQSLAEKLSMTDRVVFAGRVGRDELKTIVHAAKVFTLPSVSIAEAFGLAQVEAMAAGRPVVNTDLQTTVPFVARHEQEGLTVPPNDPPSLAAALHKLLDDPSWAERLGAAGQARAQAEYDLSAYQKRVMDVFRETVPGGIKRP